MGELSVGRLCLAVVLAFTSGVLVGWQANCQRRRFLDWRRKRLHAKLI
ncbi:mitoregulin-like [Ambystoma mexicanum]